MSSSRPRNEVKTKNVKKSKQIKGLTAAQLSQGLIISVGEARKILGAEAQGLTDTDLEELIFELSLLSQQVLRHTFEKTNRVTG